NPDLLQVNSEPLDSPTLRTVAIGRNPAADVQAFVNQFRGYSTSVLKHLRATLSCVFQTAMTWKYIQHNPATGLQLPQGKSVKRGVVLTPEQLRLVITNLQEPYKTMATVMAGTAIRESELLALKWSDLDYTNRLIHIRRSVYRGVLDEQTKTEESERDIPMCDTVVRVLLNLQKGPHNRGEYVFLTEHEKIYRPEGVQRRHFNSSAETRLVSHVSLGARFDARQPRPSMEKACR